MRTLVFDFAYGVQLGFRWIPIPQIRTLSQKIQRYNSYAITTRYEFFSKFWGYTDGWIGKKGRIDERLLNITFILFLILNFVMK